MKSVRSALVCGNGASLSRIHYDRIPRQVDIFRCNQFYFEDRYYVGRNVKWACFSQSIKVQQSYTYNCLRAGGEYNIENMCMSSYPSDLFYKNKVNVSHIEKMVGQDIQIMLNSLEEVSYFTTNLAYMDMKFGKVPTSGILMVLLAISLGYSDIYIEGIDMYSEDVPYAFDANKNNILSYFPNFTQNTSHDLHDVRCEITALRMACNYLGSSNKIGEDEIYYKLPGYVGTDEIVGGTIRSVSDSKINQYVELAPVLEEHFVYQDEIKPPGYTDDLVLNERDKRYVKALTFEEREQRLTFEEREQRPESKLERVLRRIVGLWKKYITKTNVENRYQTRGRR